MASTIKYNGVNKLCWAANSQQPTIQFNISSLFFFFFNFSSHFDGLALVKLHTIQLAKVETTAVNVFCFWTFFSSSPFNFDSFPLTFLTYYTLYMQVSAIRPFVFCYILKWVNSMLNIKGKYI